MRCTYCYGEGGEYNHKGQMNLDIAIVTQISIDGEREQHDANRMFANKKGSYNDVIEKTKSMRLKGLLTGRATLAPGNTDFINIFKHLDSLSFRAIPIAIAENMVSDTEFDDIVISYKKYILYFYELIRNKEYEKARKITELMNAIEKLEYANCRTTGCGAARQMVAVDINGNCYPCHRFVGNEKYCLGSIFSTIERNAFIEKINVNNRSVCSECWVRNLCLGGCPYENNEYGGDINKISTRSCRITKMMYEELINIYLMLTIEDKKNLFEQ